MWKLLCIAAIAAACSKTTDAPGGVTVTSAEDRCKAAIGNAMERSKADIEKASAKMAALVPALAAAMIKHCAADKWSAESTKCLTEATSYDATQKCQTMLSGEQLKLLNDEMTAIIAPAGSHP